MTHDEKLMQQALNALESLIEYDYHGKPLNDKDIEGSRSIETLRARLSQPEPEPVAVWELQDGGWDTIADPEWMESLPIGTKLYTAPPQREWQGLTDEEIEELWGEPVDCMYSGTHAGIRAIEAKLKEKNT